MKNVSVLYALQVVGDTCGYRLNETESIPLEERRIINRHWLMRDHHITSELLTQLKLTERSSSDDIFFAYQARGVSLPDWAQLEYKNGRITCIAPEALQNEVSAVNFLLENGYDVIATDEQVTEAPQNSWTKPLPESHLKLLEEMRFAKIELDDASITNVVEVIKNEWNKKHPKKSLPLTIGFFQQDRNVNPPQQLSLNDISLTDLIDATCAISGFDARYTSNIILLTSISDIIGVSDITSSITVNKKVIDKLDLTTDAQKAYADFGIEFSKWEKVSLVDETTLVISVDEEDCYVISGINSLIESGYLITKK